MPEPDSSRRAWLKRPPLYQEVRDHLRHEIQTTMRPGDRIESESQLAKRLGVSLTTVREALGSLAQDGVVERRQGSGTYVSDLFGARHVGILMGMDIGSQRTSYFYLRLLQDLRSFFERHELRAKLYLGRRPAGPPAGPGLVCPEFFEDLEASRLAALVAVATAYEPGWVQAVADARVPLVGSGNAFTYSAGPDYLQMVRLSVEYLAGCGCGRLAMLATGGRGVTDAFAAALASRQLSYRPEWVVEEAHPGLEGRGWKAFQRVWDAAETKPDGLVVCDDFMFQEVVMAVLDRGVAVPERLRIATHGTKGGFARCPFPVARLEFDVAGMVATFGDMVLNLLRQEAVPARQVRLPCRLVVSAGWNAVSGEAQ